MRRIVNGTAFDTETSTEVFSISSDYTNDFWGVYLTRNGAFFKVSTKNDQEDWNFNGLTDEETQKLVEQHAPHLVEKFFGPMPDYGSAERRITLRLHIGLAQRVEDEATKKKVTLNRYIARALEAQLKADHLSRAFGPS